MTPIYEKLKEIQKKLIVPKDLVNTFGKFNYRSCEGILEALKKVLGDLTLTLTDEMVPILDRIYVKATATLSDGENSISVSAFAREALTQKGMNDAMITGSTSSYARKCALNGLFAIDDNKDSDQMPEEVIDDKELSVIRDLILAHDVNEEKFLDYLGIPSIEEMPKSSFKQAIVSIKSKVKK